MRTGHYISLYSRPVKSRHTPTRFCPTPRPLPHWEAKGFLGRWVVPPGWIPILCFSISSLCAQYHDTGGDYCPSRSHLQIQPLYLVKAVSYIHVNHKVFTYHKFIYLLCYRILRLIGIFVNRQGNRRLKSMSDKRGTFPWLAHTSVQGVSLHGFIPAGPKRWPTQCLRAVLKLFSGIMLHCMAWRSLWWYGQMDCAHLLDVISRLIW